MGVGGLDAGAIELRRRERQLVALARHALLPRPLHVEAVAVAPGAGERAVDVDVDADVGALGGELVGGHHVVDQRLDERRLLEIEERVARTGGWCRGRCGRGAGCCACAPSGRRDGGGGGAADDGAFEKVTPRKILIRLLVLHVRLPMSLVCERARLHAFQNAPFGLYRQGPPASATLAGGAGRRRPRGIGCHRTSQGRLRRRLFSRTPWPILQADLRAQGVAAMIMLIGLALYAAAASSPSLALRRRSASPVCCRAGRR